MSVIRSKLAALALSVMAVSLAEAVPLTAYLQPDLAARIAESGSIRQSSLGKATGLSLAPDHFAAGEMRAALATEKPDIIVEALFLWQKPTAGPLEAEILAAYNVLRSVSTLQGIEYYSATRKKIRQLYSYSSLITGPEDQTPILDSRLYRIPQSRETLYARQNDTTFGDNRYRIELSAGMDYVVQHSTNLTKLSLGIVPVAGPGNIHVRLLIVRVDEGLLIYIASSARATLVPGVRTTLEESFGNRAAAVYAWFSKELTATWPKEP